jgi:hypothetical protein
VPNVPDIRVRLSAEGVQEVITAMRKVQSEAAKTEGVTALREAFSDLGKELLGGFGVGAAVAGIAELTKKSIEFIVQVGLMAQKTGASTEMLSVLSVAAKEAETSQEQLSTGLVKLSKNMDGAAQGAAQQLDAFRRLGISMKEIKRNDPGQMFLLIAQKMAGIEGGAKRAAIAQQLLGKSGADLLPLMQKLANGGFAEMEAKARSMGLELSHDTVEAVKHAHESLTELGLIAQGVATQFVVGFAPKAADAMEQFGSAVNGQGEGMKKVGEIAGEVAKFVVFVFVAAGHIIGSVVNGIIDTVSANFKVMTTLGEGAIETLKLAAKGEFSQAKTRAGLAFRDAGNIYTDLFARAEGNYSQIIGQLKTDFSDYRKNTPPTKQKDNKGGGGTDAGNLQAIAKARLALLQAQADNELAITKLKNQTEEQDNDRNYRNGITSLQDYFDKRAELIDKSMDDEIAALQQKRKNLQDQPVFNEQQELEKQKEVEALNARITEAILQRDQKIKQNEDERQQAIVQHREQELDLESKIAGAEGDRRRAEMLALDAELVRTEDLLKKQGIAAEKIKAILDGVRSAGEGKIGFDDASRRGQLATADLDLAKREIQRQADTGQINYIQAQARILQLERERIETLKEIGAEMTANAEKSKDPSLIQQAKEFNAAVKDIEASTNTVGRALGELQNESIRGAIGSFSEFIGDAVSGAKSFKDAWADLGKAFEQIIAQMIAKLIEMYLMMLIMNLIAPGGSGLPGGGSDFGGTDFTSNFNLGDNPTPSFFGDGGYTGSMATNRIAGFVHGREFVVNAGATARFRPLLEAMNAGGMRGIAQMRGSYMSGGYVAPAQGGPAVEVNVHNNTGQPVSQQQSSTPDGREILDIFIGHAAADIAQGGKLGQVIDRTYGIRRGGIRRG